MGDLILSGLTAAAAGGPIGMLVGLIKQGVQSWFQAKQEALQLEILRENNTHALAMRDKDRELIQAEATGKFEVAKVEGESLIESARIKAIAASFEADRAAFATGESARESGWFIFVDVVRGLIRPWITAVFNLAVLVIFAVLVWMLWDVLAHMFQEKDAGIVQPMFDLLREIVRSIIFLATTSAGYWFVARSDQGRAG